MTTPTSPSLPSADPEALLETLAATPHAVIIQDLDGVCMPLVRDPLTRVMDPAYIEAVARLDGRFYVLTNGEHIGRRGVNGIAERAVGTAATERGLYLPGLAAGGVQWQDRFGQVSHPGVSDAELAFLAAAPRRMTAALATELSRPDYALAPSQPAALAEAAVLDNPVSPTINLNAVYPRLRDPARDAVRLQQAALQCLHDLQAHAAEAGLADSFFIHLAPNRGRDNQGRERLAPADGGRMGTTDFQFMLAGAIKEIGVLVLLNHHIHRRTGHYPLGEDFNARQAPRDLDALVDLARTHIPADDMPRLIGVGDTVTSAPVDGSDDHQRGGSDRGFLTLIQALGQAFGTDNRTVFVDSSGGELDRPAIDTTALAAGGNRAWQALAGMTDPHDPLRLDHVVPGGPARYTALLQAVADHRTRPDDQSSDSSRPVT